MGILKELAECPRKAYYGTLGFNSETSANLYYRQVITDLLEEDGWYALKDYHLVLVSLEEAVPKEIFKMKKERMLNLTKTALRLRRMVEILILNGYRFISPGMSWGMEEGGKKIKGRYDFACDKDGIVYAVKIAFGKAAYTMLPGTDHYFGDDPEMYAMQMATGMQPAVFSLQGQECAAEDVTEYTLQEMSDPCCWNRKHWFTYDFKKSGAARAAKRELDRLVQIPVAKDNEKCEKACPLCWYRDLCQYDNTDNTDLVEIKMDKKGHQPITWTDEQKAVINSRSGEVRVLAGAGSGKTAAMTWRLISLIESGVDPRSILAVTFTEKGVREMRERIERYLTEETMFTSIDSIKVCTFNSFGHEIIRDHYQDLGYTKAPDLIDDSDRLDLLAEIMDRNPMIPGLNYTQPFMKMFLALGAVHRVSSILNVFKREMKGLSLSLDEAVGILRNAIHCEETKDLLKGMNLNLEANLFGAYEPETEKTVRLLMKILEELSAKETELNVLEYEDQVHKAVVLLRNHPEYLKEYRKHYQHIIIDEYQDTGVNQLEMIRHIYEDSSSTDRKSLMVCGDDSQSIYAFRGVDNKNILAFDQTFPEAVTLKMTENFRSTNQILNIANQIILHNGTTKTLVGHRDGIPVYTAITDTKAECEKQAAEKVIDWIRNGAEKRDIAVIARTRAEILALRSILNSEGIPNVVSVSEFLKDDNQMIGVINLASWMTDTARTKELAIWLRHSNRSEFDAAADVGGYVSEKAALMMEQIADLDDEGKYRYLMEQIHQAFDAKPSNPLKAYLKAEENKSDSFERAAEYLYRLARSNSNLGAEADETVYDAVTLSTIHAAKGREWKYVVVCGNGLKQQKCIQLDDGGFIDDTNIQYPPEEIRSFFVAVTRAKDELVILANPYWMNAVKEEPEEWTHEMLIRSGIKLKYPKKRKRAAC